MDIVITCQGRRLHTNEVYPKLRAAGWNGHWIDAASSLRMDPKARDHPRSGQHERHQDALAKGGRDWIGGNCTVSLMLMALGGLFQRDLVEWAMTYQAASGIAGAQNMRELLSQMGELNRSVKELLDDPRPPSSTSTAKSPAPCAMTPVVQLRRAAGRLVDPLDRQKDLGNGQSKEEWKGGVETNKILGVAKASAPGAVPIDGLCVRIGAMRCHSQALTHQAQLGHSHRRGSKAMLASANDWVKVVS